MNDDTPTPLTPTGDFAMSVLRNPYGHKEHEVRAARLWAGDRIEALERELARLTAENERLWNALDKSYRLYMSDTQRQDALAELADQPAEVPK